MRRRNSTIDKGRIDWMPIKKVWRAILYVGNKDMKIGDYRTREEAILVLQSPLKIKMKQNVRSPWTSKPTSTQDLHASELSYSIRELEKHYNLQPSRMQGWTRQRMEEYLYKLSRKNPVKRKKNLMSNPIEIYDTILAIEAKKGKYSNWPGEKFRHDFKTNTGAKIYGLPDGSLLIKGKKRLWKKFDYPNK